jgi:hypothetical protein
MENLIREYFKNNKVPEMSQTGKSYVAACIQGYRNAGLSAQAFSVFNKKYFEGKPKGVSTANYILNILNLKRCSKCDSILDPCNFSSNINNWDKVNAWCKKCAYAAQKPTAAANTAKYKAKKLQAMPQWADLEVIKEFYENCPKGHHVDHIIPLNGTNVCGLHVIENLQYLPAKENLKKSNKYP